MKLKYLFLTLLAAAAMAVTACEEKEQDISRPDCRFSKDTLKFDSRADFTTVKLKANRDWVITCDSSFVGIDRIAGLGSEEWQYVDISVTRNNAFNRTAKVYATAGRGLSKDLIVISQRGPKGDENEALLISIADFLAKADTQNPWVIEGTISGVNKQYSYFWLEQNGSKVEVYQPLNFSEFAIEDGGTARVKGVYEKYTNKNTGAVTHELTKGTILKYTAPAAPDPGNSIYSETFATSLGSYTETKKSGTVDKVWNYDATYKCAKATAYVNSTNNASESWLISPEIDLAGQTAATLVFDHAGNYFTSISQEVSLYISKDAGEFKQVKIPTYPTNYTFVSSGKISLKDFIGHKIKLAFVYTSTATKAGTWEVKNVVVNKEDSGDTPYVTAKVCESLAEAAALADNDLFEYNKGALVVGRTQGGIVISDGTTTLYAYGETTAAIGDKVNLKGAKATYRGLPELTFTKEDISIASSGNAVTYPAVKDITAGFDDYAATTYEYVSFTGVLTTSTNSAGTTTYYNLTVAGATAKGSIQQPLATLNVDSFKDKQVTVTGFFAGSNTTNAGEKLHNIFVTAINESNAPLLSVSSTKIDVKATDTQAVINVSGNVEWTATLATPGVTGVSVTPASGNGAGTVTVTFPENTDTENAKSYSVLIATTAAANPNSFTVVINQKKAASQGGGGEPVTISFDWSKGRTDSGIAEDWPSADNNGGTYKAKAEDGTEYSFVLGKNIYYGTGSTSKYVMLKATTSLGLPVIAGKALKKVVATGSTGHSVSTQVGISSAADAATYVTTTPNATYETWATQGADHTYELDGDADTMYYIYVTNKNCQIAKLVLTYE